MSKVTEREEEEMNKIKDVTEYAGMPPIFVVRYKDADKKFTFRGAINDLPDDIKDYLFMCIDREHFFEGFGYIVFSESIIEGENTPVDRGYAE